jgi:hypothetical protein
MLDSFHKERTQWATSTADANDGQNNTAAEIFNISKVTMSRRRNIRMRRSISE